jgi:hypothetical protein
VKISALDSSVNLENDKGGVAYGNGNKAKEYLECAATPRFLRALRLVEMTKSGGELFGNGWSVDWLTFPDSTLRSE